MTEIFKKLDNFFELEQIIVEWKKKFDLSLIDIWGSCLENDDDNFEIYYQIYIYQESKSVLFTLTGHEFPSLMNHFPNAYWPENEIYDLFGVHFIYPEGISSTRIFFPDEFIGHELRKDFVNRIDRPSLINQLKVRWNSLYDEADFFWGPENPSCRKGFLVRGEIEGLNIHQVKIELGLLHWGFEKTFENLKIENVPHYLSFLNPNLSMHWIIAYHQLIEKICCCEIPKKAQVVRIIFLEYERILENIRHLSTIAEILNDSLIREPLLDLVFCFDEIFKNVVDDYSAQNLITFGGLATDLLHDWPMNINRIKIYLKSSLEKIFKNFLQTVVWREHDKSFLTSQMAIEFGITGPLLRSVGISRDMRKLEAVDGFSSIYQKLDFDVPLGKNGSIMDIILVRFEEIFQSLKILEQLQEGLPGGAFKVEKPFLDQVTTGKFFHNLETPNGDLGIFLEMKHSSKLWRLHLRSPSFMNAQLAEKVLLDTPYSISPLILAAFNIHPGEIDR